VAKDKRDRRVNLGEFNRGRFEQEVAEEIGISLRNKGLRRGRTARDEAAAPGASELLPGPERRGRRPE